MEKNVPKLRFPEFKKEWEEKKLFEVSDINRGKSKHRPRDAEFLFGGKYPFIQTSDIRHADLYLTEFKQTYSDEGLNQSKLWDEGTLCITIAANIAETAILKIKACFPDSVIGLIPKRNETSVLFVKYLFDKFKIQIQSLSQGAAQDNLNQEKLSNIKFSFPARPEQTKIANFLTAVDEKISQLKKKKELLEQYKKGVMQQIFSQELRFKDDNGEDFSEWEEKKLGDIINFLADYTANGSFASLKENVTYYSEENYAVLVRTTDLEKSNFKPERFTDKRGYDFLKKTSLFGGELVLANVGSIGKIYKVPFYNKPMTLAPNTYTLKLNNNNSIEYIYQWMTTNEFLKKILSMVGSSTLKAINKANLRDIDIKCPSLSEQTKIANFLSAIDDKIGHCGLQIENTKRWKKGLLQQLFV